jgi:hypothetical protein
MGTITNATITTVTEKSGTNQKGGKWTRYGIQFDKAGDDWFSFFKNKDMPIPVEGMRLSLVEHEDKNGYETITKMVVAEGGAPASQGPRANINSSSSGFLPDTKTATICISYVKDVILKKMDLDPETAKMSLKDICRGMTLVGLMMNETIKNPRYEWNGKSNPSPKDDPRITEFELLKTWFMDNGAYTNFSDVLEALQLSTDPKQIEPGMLDAVLEELTKIKERIELEQSSPNVPDDDIPF